MAEPNAKNAVMVMAFIAFLVIAILLGMNIMSYIFAIVGDATSSSYDDVSVSIINESGHINSSGYQLTGANASGFLGGVVISLIQNGTQTVPTANYTYNADNGWLNYSLNWSQELGSNQSFDNVNISYTYNRKGDPRLTSEGVTNNSLVSIRTYSEQGDTQLNTVAIAITLVVLLAVFLFFWKFFMGKDGVTTSSGSGGNNSRGRSNFATGRGGGEDGAFT